MSTRRALHKLFFYGTLKRNQPNHHILQNPLNGNAKYWANATTDKKFPLVIGTRYNIPFMLNKPGVGSYVAGEIFEVDDQMLGILDNLEDSQDFSREVHDMNIGIGEGRIPCYVYLLHKYPEKLLDLPFISEYKNSPDKPYMDKSRRTKGATEDMATAA